MYRYYSTSSKLVFQHYSPCSVRCFGRLYVIAELCYAVGPDNAYMRGACGYTICYVYVDNVVLRIHMNEHNGAR